VGKRRREQGHPARIAAARASRSERDSAKRDLKSLIPATHPLGQLVHNAIDRGPDALDEAVGFVGDLMDLEQAGHIRIDTHGADQFELVPLDDVGREALA
jgi:hypothetical protein